MKDKGLGMAWQIEGVHYNMKIKRIEFFKTMNFCHFNSAELMKPFRLAF